MRVVSCVRACPRSRVFAKGVKLSIKASPSAHPPKGAVVRRKFRIQVSLKDRHCKTRGGWGARTGVRDAEEEGEEHGDTRWLHDIDIQ